MEYPSFEILKKTLAFLLGILVVLYFTLNITGTDLQYFPGDEGDARFNTYVLENGHQFLIGNRSSMWEAPFLKPEHNVISYSDNLIGTVPFYSVFRFLNFDRETSFQLWFICMFLLSYVCCFLFLKSQVKNVYASIIGGLIFAVSMAMQSQMTHAQVFPVFPIPLAFWMLALFVKHKKPLYFFLSILFVVYQMYCSVYLGLLLIVPFFLVFLILIVQNKQEFITNAKRRLWSVKIILSILINSVLLWIIISPYYYHSLIAKGNSEGHIFNSIPTIESYFYTQKGTWIWSFLSSTGESLESPWDHQIFVGGIALTSILFISFFALNKRKFGNYLANRYLNVLLIVGALIFAVFVRIGDYSLYQLLWKLPGLSSLRSLTRIVNVELFFCAVAVAVVLKVLLEKYHKHSLVLFLIVLSLVVIDNGHDSEKTYRTKKLDSQERVQILVNKIKGLPKKSVISYEPEFLEYQAFVYQIDAMLATQSIGLKTINGYTATSPQGYENYWWNLNEEGRIEWLNANPEFQDSVVVIH